MSSLSPIAQLDLALDPVHDTQRTFRTLLVAMARPGQVQQLPVAAVGAPANPWVAAVLLTLADHEVTLAVEPFEGADEMAGFVGRRTAAVCAPTERADFVVAARETLDPDLPLRLRRGSPAYPDDAATLIVAVARLGEGDPSGTRPRLEGPGVPAGQRLHVSGLAPRFFEARAEAIDFPCGIDLLLIDPEGRVAALPRSTRIAIEEIE